MTSRRGFLAGLLASGLAPQASWADLGAPAFLSAARAPDGRYLLAGLSYQGDIRFTCPLPGRGHAAAAHPNRPEAIAFARRPGRFAEVIDCLSGATLAQLQPPASHHFYGHGCFTPDGKRLFTTENDFENSRGVIGVWQVGASYQRIGSFSSGGIGPHDLMLRQTDSSVALVVANGGIETHPDSGRAKLNIPDMRPNLSLLSLDGTMQDQMQLGSDLRMNSIRHLALAADGTIGFAMQWQGDQGSDLPIVGLYSPGNAPRLMAQEDPRLRHLNGYGGSLAFADQGRQIAVTSPRGGVVQVMNTGNGTIVNEHPLTDVCGLATTDKGLVASTGTGQLISIATGQARRLQSHGLAWDNHLIPRI